MGRIVPNKRLLCRIAQRFGALAVETGDPSRVGVAVRVTVVDVRLALVVCLVGTLRVSQLARGVGRFRISRSPSVAGAFGSNFHHHKLFLGELLRLRKHKLGLAVDSYGRIAKNCSYPVPLRAWLSVKVLNSLS